MTTQCQTPQPTTKTVSVYRATVSICVSSRFSAKLGLHMSLNQLRYFVAVAEEGQVSRAAKKLFVSQPPLSQRLRELEAELGVNLFDRTPRGMKLTVAGSQFLDTARHVLRRLEDGVSAMRAHQR